MPSILFSQLTAIIRQSNYHIIGCEQTRSTRWIFILRDTNGDIVILMVQTRPIVGASDVQDLAELVQLQRANRGFLWAYYGSFSKSALQTRMELGSVTLSLINDLPVSTGSGSIKGD